jgi:hypothetical protein
MTFQSTIPKSTDLISVSQGDILNNFTAIGTSFDVNHIDFNASGAGKHKFVEMPNQGSDPAGAGTEGTAYTKVAAPPSVAQTELFFRRDVGSVIQMTRGDPIVGAKGTSFLPGGIKLNWGQVAATPGGTTENWASAFTSALFVVTLGVFNNNGTSVATWANGGLTSVKFFSATSATVYYLAIGA